MVECIDCHMPHIVKSAVGDADKHTGDIRAHM
jgi:formate-dependent nitrite reductase cytochrome c552 subunit